MIWNVPGRLGQWDKILVAITRFAHAFRHCWHFFIAPFFEPLFLKIVANFCQLLLWFCYNVNQRSKLYVLRFEMLKFNSWMDSSVYRLYPLWPTSHHLLSYILWRYKWGNTPTNFQTQNRIIYFGWRPYQILMQMESICDMDFVYLFILFQLF